VKLIPGRSKVDRNPAAAGHTHLSHEAESEHEWHILFLAAMVFGAVLCVFLPVAHCEFVDWDDPANFLRNQDYRGLGWHNIRWAFSTTHMGHYQPLSWLTLGFDAVMGDWLFNNRLDPRPYHFTNVLLHSLNAALFMLLTMRLLERGQRTAVTQHLAIAIGACAAALFFGLHPLRVESVAWATERRDLLSALFALLTMLAYLRAAGANGAGHWRWLCVALGLFLLSLLSKVIGVTLPVVMLILDVYPLRRLSHSPREWLTPSNPFVILEKIPFFIAATAFSALASILQGKNHWLISLHNHPLAARIAQSCYGLVFYAWKTLLPTNLLPLYQLRMPMNIAEARFILAVALVIVSAIVCFLLRHRAPLLVAAALVYAIMLLPVLGLVQNGPQIVADRYSYLACLGWAVVFGAAIARLMQRPSRAVMVATSLVATTLLVGLSWLTIRQIGVWRNAFTLWEYAALRDPIGPFAQNGYGYALMEKGRMQEAEEHLRMSLSLLDTNIQAQRNLWNLLQKQDRDDDLIAAYTQAEAVSAKGAATENGVPVPAEAHYNHALWHMNRQEWDKAADHLRKAIDVKPDYAEAHVNLGTILLRQSDRDGAIREFRAAIDADANLLQAHYNLALALRDSGQTTAAIDELRIALRINPAHANARKALDALMSH
jgi:protein O-mannosyl-transferase